MKYNEKDDGEEEEMVMRRKRWWDKLIEGKDYNESRLQSICVTYWAAPQTVIYKINIRDILMHKWNFCLA